MRSTRPAETLISGPNDQPERKGGSHADRSDRNRLFHRLGQMNEQPQPWGASDLQFVVLTRLGRASRRAIALFSLEGKPDFRVTRPAETRSPECKSDPR